MTEVVGMNILPLRVRRFICRCLSENGPFHHVIIAKKGRSKSFELHRFDPYGEINCLYVKTVQHWTEKTVFEQLYTDVWEIDFSKEPLPCGENPEVINHGKVIQFTTTIAVVNI